MKRVFFTLGLIAILTMNCLVHAQTDTGRPPLAGFTETALFAQISPRECRNYIEGFIQQWPNDTPYTGQSYDCSAFADTFQRMCTHHGFICARVSISCEKGTHAVNLACYGSVCCGVEPQGQPPSDIPVIIPGTCFLSDGVPDELTKGQCQLFCQGKRLGDCKESLVYTDLLPMGAGKKTSVWCYQQTISNSDIAPSFGNCCECCCNIWKKNPNGYWGESCQAQCQNILINKGITPYPCRLHNACDLQRPFIAN